MYEETLQAWICTALMRIGTRMATEFDHHFAKLGINQAQFRLLLAVSDQEQGQGITPSHLADYLFIERGTVSVLSNRLVKRGWLQRLPGENRRSYLLALTPEGKRTLDAVVPLALELADDSLSGLTTSQMESLRRSLTEIEQKLRLYHP